MGYYTSYTLKIKEGDPYLLEEYIEGSEHAKYAMNNKGEATEGIKWYDHEIDLKNFSKKHPNTVFELYGEGEEAEDIWYKYFKDGKVQVCKAKIAFDNYDPKKLI